MVGCRTLHRQQDELPCPACLGRPNEVGVALLVHCPQAVALRPREPMDCRDDRLCPGYGPPHGGTVAHVARHDLHVLRCQVLGPRRIARQDAYRKAPGRKQSRNPGAEHPTAARDQDGHIASRPTMPARMAAAFPVPPSCTGSM